MPLELAKPNTRAAACVVKLFGEAPPESAWRQRWGTCRRSDLGPDRVARALLT